MKSTIALVTGPKSSGKTHTAREIISLHPRVLALDPHGGEFRLPGAVTVREEDELLAAMRANWKRPCWLIVSVPDYGRLEEASESVAYWAFRRGYCLAVFDECGAYMEAGRLGPCLGRLAMQSRHRSANILFCSPRLVDISTDARTQADLWVVCGSIWTARDLEVIEQHTSLEFRRKVQEPLNYGQHRRLCFDTRTREEIELSTENLRRLFNVPRIERPAALPPGAKPEPMSWWKRFWSQPAPF